MGENGSLSAKQLRGLEALLTERSVRAAALACGVGETTLFRWLSDPSFAAYYRAAQDRLFEGAIGTLQQAAAEAVEILRDVLRDSEAKPSERVSAARSILEFAIKTKELIELEQRLAALEEGSKQEAA